MHPAPIEPRPAWEIFCQVVDNFGDIGVCWRLARDLVRRKAAPVRLWVDDWAVLCRICPPAAVGDGGHGVVVEGVELRHWVEPFPALEPGEVVIEAFACELPDTHLQSMVRQAVKPVWINLEYLSAEDWVAGCHGLASPHPRLALVKYFFFPGFDAASGGLLREADLMARREAFVDRPEGRRAWRAARGLAGLPADTLFISLFAYAQPALGELLATWQDGPRPVALLVPQSRMLDDVAQALGVPELRVGEAVARGHLSVFVLPFTDQAGYDELLWSCALNFVRGEDSFVRAQWAGSPFVWQIYPQAEDAHRDKLEAFLARYCAGLSVCEAEALAGFWRAWNAADGAGPTLSAAWRQLSAVLPALDAHAQRWCARQAAQPDLVSRLTKFCSHIQDGAG